MKYMIHIIYKTEDEYERDAVYFGDNIDDIKSEIYEDAQYYNDWSIEGIYKLYVVEGNETVLPDSIGG